MHDLVSNLDSFLSVLPNVTLIWDISGKKIITINRSLFQELGYKQDSLSDNSWQDLIHPNDAFSLSEITYSQYNATIIEVRLQLVDKNWACYSLSIKPIDIDGVDQACIISFAPIKQTSKLQQSLLESNERFKALAESSFGGIAIHDKGVIIEANHGLSQMTGFTVDELVGMDGLQLIAQHQRDYVMSQIVKGYETPYRSVGLTKSGEEYPLEIRGKQIPYKGKIVRVTEFRNIEEQLQYEQTIAENEKKYKDIIEFAVDGFVIGDKNGVVVATNQRFLEIAGRERANVEGEHISAFFNPDDLNSKPLRFDLLKKGQTVVTEREVIRPDGAAIQIEMHSKQMPDGSYQAIVRDVTERNKNKRELEKNEAKFHALFYYATDAIFLVDKNGVFIECNPKTEHTFACSKQQILGKTPADFSPQLQYNGELSLEKAIFNIQKAFNGEPLFFEWIHKDIHGNLIDTEVNLNAVSFGGEAYVQAIVRNISSRKKAEKALGKERLLMHNMLENVVDQIYFKDLKSRFIRASKNVVERFGLKHSDDIVGKTDFDFFAADHAQMAFDVEQKIIETGKPIVGIEEREIWPDGRITWVSTTKAPLIDTHGKIIGTFGISRNITENKKAREQAELEKAYFEQLFESSPEGIVVLDTNDCVVNANAEFQKIFGYSLSEMQGKPINSLIVPTDFKDGGQELTEAVAKGETVLSETVRCRKDGSLVHVSILGHPIYFHGGKIAVYGIYRDITDRKMVQEELLQKTHEIEAQNEEYRVINEELYEAKKKAEESDRLKSAFLANMSHEIRTPMNGILGFSQLLTNPELSDVEVEEYVEVVQNCGNQLLSIINDLIDISKIEANQISIFYSPVDLNQLMHEQFLIFKAKTQEKGLDLSYTKGLPDREAIISTDSSRVRQIVGNLLNNAIKFTQHGHINFGYTLKDNVLQFFVEDSGVGISPEHFDSIFERFSQVETRLTEQYGGTGLGLAISKAYIKKMGGDIWVESTHGMGSTFIFTLPYKPVAQPKKTGEPTAEQQISAPKGVNLLVAEDDEVNFMYIRELFANNNFNLIWAKNGLQAVDAVRVNPNIDMVLMDIKMPMMDGYQATGEIKKIRKDLTVIAQTAYAFESDKEKAIQAGCDDYISKPIDRKKLLSLMNKYLKK